MIKSLSIYLDFLRFLAALLVFFVHANYDRFTTDLPIAWRVSDLGNDAVMLFFVLSGFVIAYVADQKEKTPREYFISRFARLYSVVVPALIITIVVDQFGVWIEPDAYDGWWFQDDMPVWRFVANLLFVNELWFNSVRPFSNGPFWSLGYEFWYYVVFAAAYFIKRPVVKYAVVAAICLLIGPKILLLMPVWLLGVLVYHIAKHRMVPEKFGWSLFLGSMFLYAYYRLGGYPDAIYQYMVDKVGYVFLQDTLRWSQEFISSYIIGVLVATHFIGAAIVMPRMTGWLEEGESTIRYLAGYSFAMYLLHYPLLQFFGALTVDFDNNGLRNAIVIFGSLAVIWMLGWVTERRKPEWRRWTRTAFDTLLGPSKRKSKVL